LECLKVFRAESRHQLRHLATGLFLMRRGRHFMQLVRKPHTPPPSWTKLAQQLLTQMKYSAHHMDGQATHTNDKDVHFLYDPLKQVLEIAMSTGEDSELTVDRILRLLDKKRLVTYARKGQVQLLNSHGRILVAILEDPGITQRALAQYVGVSESNVNATVKQLLKGNLITKKKVKNRNVYYFNYEEGLRHPDISRFLDTLLPYVKEISKPIQPE
jgi:predicted transcriptional regulator